MGINTVEFKKTHGSVLLGHDLKLAFLMEQQGSQGLTCVALDSSIMDSPRLVKYYGVIGVLNTEESLNFLMSDEPDLGRRARDTWQHEKAGLKIVSVNYPVHPQIIKSYEESSGLLSIVMSFGLDSEFCAGNLVTEDQVLSGKRFWNTPDEDNLLKILQDEDIYAKLRRYINIGRIVDSDHRHFGIVHNDLKLSQLLNELKSTDRSIVQAIIDYGSHLPLNNPSAMQARVLQPSTMPYNDTMLLEIYLRTIKGEIDEKEHRKIAEDMLDKGSKDSWRGIISRDIISLGYVGQEMLFPDESFKKFLGIHGNISEIMGYSTMYPGCKDPDKEISELERLLELRKEYFKSFIPREIDPNIADVIMDMSRLDADTDKRGLDEFLFRLEDLLPEKQSERKKTQKEQHMKSRRKFIITSAIGIGSLIAVGSAYDIITKIVNSPAQIKQQLLDKYQSHGTVDDELLHKLTTRILEEYFVRPIESVKRAFRNNHDLLEKVVGDKYQLATDTMLEAHYCDSLVLTLGKELKRDEMIEFYFQLIGSKSISHPENGYRIARLTFSLEEFLDNAAALNAPHQLIERSKELLEDSRKLIMKTHLVNGDGIIYFQADPNENPAVRHPGYKHLLRADSYFIAKNAWKFAPMQFEGHMSVMKKTLIRDDACMDYVYFNSMNDMMPDAEANKGILSINQVMMIDLLLEQGVINGVQSISKDAVSMIDKYNASLTSSPVHDSPVRGNPIHGLISHDSLNGGQINNLPLIFYANTLFEKKLLRKNDADSLIASAIEKFDCPVNLFSSSDGLLPQCRRDIGTGFYKWIMSDMLAIRMMQNYLKNYAADKI